MASTSANEPDGAAADRADARLSPALRLRRRRRRRMAAAARKGVAISPTLFTLANALSGFMAIFLASRPPDIDLPMGLSPLVLASMCIFLAMFFDAIDGQIARLTRSVSELGAQLDSMADMVSFGVAPAFIAVQLAGVRLPFVSIRGDHYYDRLALIAACIYVACAALRLARFNLEADPDHARGHTIFRGLPSPGAAGTIAGLVMLHAHLLAGGPEWLTRVSAMGVLGIMLLTAFAMISRMPYVHVINRYLRGRAPFGYVAMGVVVLLLLSVAPQWSIAIAFVSYALSAPITRLLRLRGSRRAATASQSPP
jgi:CDP-diacylglycerol---serine O-phosphatidyltransferase